MTKTFKIANGDVVRSVAGRFTFIEGRPKAEQSLARLLALDAPAGAGLDALIGSVPTDAYALSADVQEGIRRAFNTLVDAQRRIQRPLRTPAEMLVSIRQMYVVPARFSAIGGPSKTGYAFAVNAVTAAGEATTGSGTLTPPQG